MTRKSSVAAALCWGVATIVDRFSEPLLRIELPFYR